jgi:hypothetical protein
MKNETLERELKSELDRWGRENTRLIQNAGKTKTKDLLSLEKKDLAAMAFTRGQNAAVELVEGDEATDDALFVKEPPIDIWGG